MAVLSLLSASAVAPYFSNPEGSSEGRLQTDESSSKVLGRKGDTTAMENEEI